MSYCRRGENSDVYVIRSGDHLVCFGHEPAFACFSEQDMIDHLFAHRTAGDVIPQRAFDRLSAERDGLPYKTDVEHALDTLNLDAVGVESADEFLKNLGSGLDGGGPTK